MRENRSRAMILGLLILAAGGPARAQDQEEPRRHYGFFERMRLNREGKPPAGKPRSIPHTDARAGYPHELAGHPRPTETRGGIGYYVGGSVPIGHRLFYADRARRRRDEGTWGWDETGGFLFRRRAILGWSHGRRYQGGTGSYPTDGPIVPDLIYAANASANSHGRRDGGEGHPVR